MNHRSLLFVSFSFVCTAILVVRAESSGNVHVDSDVAIAYSHSDTLLLDAEDMLVNHHVVTLGMFETLATPATKDIFSFRQVKQRFRILEMYKGPNEEWIDVLVGSASLPFPGEQISVYEKNQRLNNRLTLLTNNVDELRQTILDMPQGNERMDHINILRGFVRERDKINQQYPNLPVMLVIEPLHERRDQCWADSHKRPLPRLAPRQERRHLCLSGRLFL